MRGTKWITKESVLVVILGEVFLMILFDAVKSNLEGMSIVGVCKEGRRGAGGGCKKVSFSLPAIL
jgi:hypothetical protein